MKQAVQDDTTRQLQKGESLSQAGETGAVWRVVSGALMLDYCGAEGQFPLQVALPGDLIGVETLVGEHYTFSATAIVETVVQLHEVGTDAARSLTVEQGFKQQQKRLLDIVRMRSGNVRQRLTYFVSLLERGLGLGDQTITRQDLPTLRQMSLIVGSALETVCRELNAVIPARITRAASQTS